ncbi:hypothetical protein AVEN_238475-1 [Araneus ventricosus]|uniref:Uncharacterized protein n=1 Tax=Araneus ventricosus TaxID=182803 RepID=A0A4Y2VNP1_ARAVE|nr:hypothetical protein AVEN_238475-1 [Araneus ventricosus]
MQLIQQPVGNARSYSLFVDSLVFDVRYFTEMVEPPHKATTALYGPTTGDKAQVLQTSTPKPLAIGAGSEDVQCRSLMEFIAVSEAWSCSMFLKIIFFC